MIIAGYRVGLYGYLLSQEKQYRLDNLVVVQG